MTLSYKAKHFCKGAPGRFVYTGEGQRGQRGWDSGNWIAGTAGMEWGQRDWNIGVGVGTLDWGEDIKNGMGTLSLGQGHQDWSIGIVGIGTLELGWEHLGMGWKYRDWGGDIRIGTLGLRWGHPRLGWGCRDWDGNTWEWGHWDWDGNMGHGMESTGIAMGTLRLGIWGGDIGNGVGTPGTVTHTHGMGTQAPGRGQSPL